ncbi:MAG: CCA tRNA nucleotidyltransferase [Bacillati bacterium ANGP1]|uniref:CCA tRNA nucleotidyltransferase n=1 Tax=Candidatus Segetimicrobium genomatis TaxID=2569760 RepID=A0A537LRH7_9BACT|nr:MAG: CCA tRNA nucleotidyltransferase [Terrabacteria group bacterium ANGP1]
MGSLSTAGEIVARLRAAGFETYLVGGCVRDMLLGREPADYDIATAAKPDEVRALFARTVDVGAAFGVVRVLGPDGEYEVATFRAEGPYLDGRHPASVRYATAREDVARRDFTVNGLLYDPGAGAVLDFVGGQADLAARRIRTIGDPATRFAEDRLRMLRAVRLAVDLGFTIDEEVTAAARRFARRLAEVSPERIRDELILMVTGPDPARALGLLHDTGLLAVLLPEVEAEVGVPQPEEFHPEGDVFEHTRLALGQLRAPSVTLAMATLLHDVGKPPTLVRADRIRFSRHDEVGAAIARTVMERLRFPRRETDRVVGLVGRHMVFKDVMQMREARVRRLVADEGFPELLELHRADCAASHGDLSTYRWVRVLLDRLAGAPPIPARLITGDDVVALGVAPGPRVGRVLRAVENAHLEGEIHTREEALALARALAASRGRPEGSSETPLPSP